MYNVKAKSNACNMDYAPTQRDKLVIKFLKRLTT